MPIQFDNVDAEIEIVSQPRGSRSAAAAPAKAPASHAAPVRIDLRREIQRTMSDALAEYLRIRG